MKTLRHIMLLLAVVLSVFSATASGFVLAEPADDDSLCRGLDAVAAETALEDSSFFESWGRRVMPIPTDSSRVVRVRTWGTHRTEKTVQFLPSERTWLFGVNYASLYDAYLSPLDYTGPAVSVAMQNVRQAKWNECVTNLVKFNLNGTYASNPNGNGQFYDGQLNFGFGWVYHWDRRYSHGRVLRVGVGGLAEFSGGGTYSTRNGNNPGQGRAAFDVAPVLQVRYAFRGPRCMRLHYVRRGDYYDLRPGEQICTHPYYSRSWDVRAQLELPLVGVMFSPQYGQSYYELFELGNYDHNVCLTYPGNAPSARLSAMLNIPVSMKNDLVIGYRGEVLQSHVNGLRRHSWQNGIVIGFTHYMNLNPFR